MKTRPDQRGGRRGRRAARRSTRRRRRSPTLDPPGCAGGAPAGVRRADAGDAGRRAVRRRRLALRAQVGRLPHPGDRDRRAGRAPDAQPARRRAPTSRSCSAAPTWLAAPEAIVDGEVVALDAEGRPDFGLLQARLGGGFSASDQPASPEARAAGAAAPLVFMAFDLPWCAGPLVPRRDPRGAQGDPAPRPPRAPPRPVRRARRPRRRRVLRGDGGAGPRGRDGEAPPQPVRGRAGARRHG